MNRSHRYKWPKGDTSPRYVVAVDPGLRCCGVAIGLVTEHGSALYRADAVYSEGIAVDPTRTMADAVTEHVRRHTTDIAPIVWVYEEPTNYPGEPGRASDLANLRRVLDKIRTPSGRLLMSGEPTRFPPRAWKGNVSKVVHHARIEARIADPCEWEHIEDDHNARDAAGLWYFAVGRCGRGGTASRANSHTTKTVREIRDMAEQAFRTVEVDKVEARRLLDRLYDAATKKGLEDPLWDLYLEARELLRELD